MNKSSLYISVLALVVAAAALAVSVNCPCSKQAPAAAALDSQSVATVLNDNPQIIIDSLQKYEQNQREEQARQAAKVFVDNLEEVNNNPDTPFVGNKDAKVVLVEFFDFSCGYCKRLAPSMESIVEANPDIKVVFKPITFVAPISKYAAQAALAANNQGKFMEMYKLMLAAPERLTEESVNAFAAQAGLDMDRFNADVKSEKVAKTIKDVASLAEKLQIRGVPSLVLNGKPLQAVDAEGIQSAINELK
jgi:protein-disulfide isomerase